MSDINGYRPYWTEGKNLSIGCGWQRLEGDWTTLDMDPRAKPDVVAKAEKMPFPEGHFDFVLASHVLEHCLDPFPVVSETWRVLKPGGHFLVVVPHALSYGYLIPPMHMRPFLPDTFYFFMPEACEIAFTHGSGGFEGRALHPWTVEKMELTPVDEYSWFAKHFRKLFCFLGTHCFGMYQDIYCLMRKAEA